MTTDDMHGPEGIKPNAPYFFQRHATLTLIVFNLLTVSLLLALIEAAWLFLLANPTLLMSFPKPIRLYIKKQYLHYDKKTIQYAPACARFDDQLFYTLRPGSCRMSSPEFDIEYRINSMGLRDDEESLYRPKIVVLGDSMAMGWGVPKESSFVELIESRTGLRTLNCGISSYGTAREMLMYSHVDNSASDVIIIQYHGNDFFENVDFDFNRRKSLRLYEELLRYEHGKRYLFGANIWHLLKQAIPGVDKMESYDAYSGATPDSYYDQIAAAFLSAIIRSGVDFSGKRIILLKLDDYDKLDKPFLAAVNRRIAAGQYPAYIKNIQIVDVSKDLKEDDYYILDEHINERGHSKVADRLIEAILKDTSPVSKPRPGQVYNKP